VTDADLYLRGTATVVACWTSFAGGSHGAAVVEGLGVAAAVFPADPERLVYNNAILDRGLAPSRRDEAVDAMEAAYAAAGVARFAAWVHERDAGMRAQLERRVYTVAESTRAMGMALDELRVPRPELDLRVTPDWDDYLGVFALPPGLLGGADRSSMHVAVARLDGEDVATALAFDHDGDCGIYNVVTLEHARRRGLGSALTALQLHDAVDRGCRTASVQSTEAAERVYAAVGFRDLGRILEYVPPARASAQRHGRR
jgi:GNAT superfamily N-acetyltransferase